MEARNVADSLVYSTEKSLAEFGDKVSAEDKGAIETELEALKSAINDEDVDAMKAKTESLSQVSMKLGEAMYQASQEEAAAGAEDAADGGSDGADDVVDADFEEVDDDKTDKNKTA